MIFNKKAASITGLENSALQLFIAFITAAVFVGFKNGFAIAIPSESVLPIAILGLFNTGIGCYLYFSSIGKISVQAVAICGYLEPLSAVLFSVLFLQEILVPIQIVGTILIIWGVIGAEFFKKKQKGLSEK